MFLDAPDATVALSREVVGMGSKARGFTLIELMVIVVLLAILAFMAIPSFKAMQEGNNHLAGKEVFQKHLEFARAYAMSSKSTVEVCAESGGWTDGYVVRKASDKSVLLKESRYKHIHAVGAWKSSVDSGCVRFVSNGTAPEAPAATGKVYDSGFYGGESLDKAAWRITFKPSGWSCQEKDPKEPACAVKPS
ncbi:pilus assembly FimT family protein [Pseudomonas aeruginosa]|uniref:pilus assembly FimT family protein n=2 Tax=Pseudomonas aeruginosa TaxID=287 RepID=UPI0012FE4D6A|nr:GspH/FimT family pseudopilin [Pseudomonas aeruginosa]EKW7733476.1 GspH/FimT family pseudopilin [Pseudomonas aeruginosa]ELS0736632.1 GspH/FimT family pseudopilin [Pseudomonas aeruginosa]MBG4417379.1 GspH/FimT family pseudopilin [Pseudomonas aeruginosa]MBG4503319.1 GspH/FimT family pseudopilin [Pseudomonas aeruginosa]MBG4877831.1 GspH/FimT family pseudopilin [Pseudomonas aeruginosa]